MTSVAEMESIHRVELLRAELDRSLKLAAADASAGAVGDGEKRPIMLFQSAEAAHVQISGPVRVPTAIATDLIRPAIRSATVTAASRFTVSPTPNAVPAMVAADGSRPLRVLTNNDKVGDDKPVSIPAAATVLTSDLVSPIAASSPASSVDSGIASPGVAASDFLSSLFPQTASPPAYPSWATVPRTRRWVFNFASNGSLIDALALSARKLNGGISREMPVSQAVTDPPPLLLTLQKPPMGKKYGPFTNNDQPQQQSSSSTSQPANGYFKDSNDNTTMVSASSSDLDHPQSVLKKDNNSSKPAMVAQPMQRQLSEGCAPMWDAVGLPPRAATMPPLKSILKKPRTDNNGLGHAMDPSLPRNHLRRMPTRIVLNRSVSESLLDRANDIGVPDNRFSALQHSAAAMFNATILSKLSSSSKSSNAPQLDTFDEQLEEQQVKEELEREQQEQAGESSSSSPSSCSSETIDSDGQPAPIVKKRVSFSEHVQARIYRSNSSILGQRRKNEKKSRHRTNKRCNSDASQQSEEELEQNIQQQAKKNTATFKNSSPSLICRSRDTLTSTASPAGLPLLAQ